MRKQSKNARHPDAALIRNCVQFCQAVEAIEAGFVADPTGDSDFAGPASSIHHQQAWRLLKLIAPARPSTPDGLFAKVRIVGHVIKEWGEEAGCPDALHLAYLSSLRDDVVRFLQPICEGDQEVVTKGAEIVPLPVRAA